MEREGFDETMTFVRSSSDSDNMRFLAEPAACKHPMGIEPYYLTQRNYFTSVYQCVPSIHFL